MSIIDIHSYSILDCMIEQEMLINSWKDSVVTHITEASISFAYWYKRLSTFHSRIVKIRNYQGTHIDIQSANEMVERLNKRIHRTEQNISITKKNIADLKDKEYESIKYINTFYGNAIAEKTKNLAFKRGT